jgi:hypothetical protein
MASQMDALCCTVHPERSHGLWVIVGCLPTLCPKKAAHLCEHQDGSKMALLAVVKDG